MKNQRNIFLVSMLFIAGTTDAAGGENQQDGFFPPEVYMSNILFTLVEDQSVEDKRLDTVLGEAVRHLNYKKVNQLLDMTSAIDEVNNFGESALMIAASNGDIEMLELLLQRGANINLSTNCKGTALSQAARHNKLNSVRFLLNHGAMVDKGADFFNNMTPLQEAVRHGNVSIIEELLKRGVNPNVQEGFCKTFPLKNAVIFGHFASVLALLNGGANINAGCGFLNETALHEVAKRGKVDLAIILLKYKANPFLTDCYGQKPSAVALTPEMKKFLKDEEKRKNSINLLMFVTRTVKNACGEMRSFFDVNMFIQEVGKYL